MTVKKISSDEKRQKFLESESARFSNDARKIELKAAGKYRQAAINLEAAVRLHLKITNSDKSKYWMINLTKAANLYAKAEDYAKAVLLHVEVNCSYEENIIPAKYYARLATLSFPQPLKFYTDTDKIPETPSEYRSYYYSMLHRALFDYANAMHGSEKEEDAIESIKISVKELEKAGKDYYYKIRRQANNNFYLLRKST